MHLIIYIKNIYYKMYKIKKINNCKYYKYL